MSFDLHKRWPRPLAFAILFLSLPPILFAFYPSSFWANTDYEQLGLAVDLRKYEQCGEILTDLGIKRVLLISNNPAKIRALTNCGMEIVERVPLEIKFHRSFARYLRTKREEMGHLISLPEDIYEQSACAGLQAV